jgi:hypothetical protein
MSTRKRLEMKINQKVLCGGNRAQRAIPLIRFKLCDV